MPHVQCNSGTKGTSEFVSTQEPTVLVDELMGLCSTVVLATILTPICGGNIKELGPAG